VPWSPRIIPRVWSFESDAKLALQLPADSDPDLSLLPDIGFPLVFGPLFPNEYIDMIQAARNLLKEHPRAEWVIPGVLCIILLMQMLFSVRQMSQHADEATHLYAGYRALKCSDYAFGREHPPLAKMLSAAPLLWSDIAMDCSQREVGVDEEDQATHWLYSQPDWWPLLMKARLASSLTAVLLCLGVWTVARRMFGRMVAVVSTAVLAFEPNVLGHGALVLNNILLAALFLLTIFCFYLWTRERTVPLLVGTGLCLGLALLTKHSAVLLAVLLILLAAAEPWLETGEERKRAARALRNLGAVALIAVIAAATIWCGYGMRYSQARRRISDSIPDERLAVMTGPDLQVLKAVRAMHLLPQPYLDGLIELRGMVTRGGDMVNILGRPYSEAPWFFLPLVTSVKLTAAFLAMLGIGVAGLVLTGKERRKEIVFLALPALLFLASSMRIQRTVLGIWHLFPMIPFLIILAAAGCVSLARRHRWASVALVCLLSFHAVSSLRVYPNYLCYANEFWGGPQNLYKKLPWADLNQTYWEVAQYMKQHPNTPCWLDSDWMVPAEKYGVPCTQMGNHWEIELPTRMKGIVFVSSTWLEIYGRQDDPLEVFLNSQPKALLGDGAMVVYEGEFDTRLMASMTLDSKVLRLLRTGDRFSALSPAERAVEISPTSPQAHDYLCLSLAFGGYPEKSLPECVSALQLAKARPNSEGHVSEIRVHIETLAKMFNMPLPPGVE
jgi:hypothetical protein